MYRKLNVNPKNKRTNDCVIRAVTKALNSDWQTEYFNLCRMGSQLCCMPSSDEAIEAYLKQKGFIRKTFKIHKGDRRLTAGQFGELFPVGVYLLKLAGHITCLINGDIYDIWDCSEKCVYSYYERA